MALVYDVIQDVTPDGARNSSHPLGSWLVAYFDSASQAERWADRANECCLVSGITYRVEAIDEESPERHHYYADLWRDAAAVVRRIQRLTRNGGHYSKNTSEGRMRRSMRARSIRVSRSYGRQPLGWK